MSKSVEPIVGNVENAFFIDHLNAFMPLSVSLNSFSDVMGAETNCKASTNNGCSSTDVIRRSLARRLLILNGLATWKPFGHDMRVTRDGDSTLVVRRQGRRHCADEGHRHCAKEEEDCLELHVAELLRFSIQAFVGVKTVELT